MKSFPTEPVLLRIAGRRLTLLHLDFSIAVLWFAVTAAQFRYDELLLYPMALYFTYALIRDRYVTWDIFRLSWPLMLLPIWWIVSTSWSPEPALAFRSGLQALLTMLICVFLGSRLTRRQLLLIALAAMTIVAIRSLPETLSALARNDAAKGIFVHKNPFGSAMTIYCISALGILLGRDWPRLIRMFAVGSICVAVVLVIATKSATALLVTILLTSLVIAGLVYLGRRQILTPLRLALVGLTLSVGSIGGAVAINTVEENPIDAVLDALGKDRSLTGRTGLWDIAKREIAERPVIGTGAKGYWRYDDSALIRQIYIDYYKQRGNVFHFHNSWLNIAVEFGLVGAAMAAFALAWAMIIALSRAVRQGGAEDWAFFAIGIALFIRSMVEAELFGPFIMLNMMFFTSVLIRIPARRKAATASVPRRRPTMQVAQGGAR